MFNKNVLKKIKATKTLLQGILFPKQQKIVSIYLVLRLSFYLRPPNPITTFPNSKYTSYYRCKHCKFVLYGFE